MLGKLIKQTSDQLFRLVNRDKSPASLESDVVVKTGRFIARGISHVGCVRTNNEDNILLLALDEDCVLAAVADGVGGQDAGEVASGLACLTVKKIVEDGGIQSLGYDPEAITGVLTVMVHEAHRAIGLDARKHPERHRMACTLTLALLTRNTVVCAHVGDSRLYRMHSDRLEQISTDQTVAVALMESGRITKEEAANHPKRNVLEHALGVEAVDNPIVVQKSSIALNEGDSLLICSDGLTDMVSDEQIAKVLSQTGNSHKQVDLLVGAALEAGGKDNVSVICINQTVKKRPYDSFRSLWSSVNPWIRSWGRSWGRLWRSLWRK